MTVLNALYISRRPVVAFVVVGVFWGCFAALVPVYKSNLGVNDAVFGTLLLGSALGLVSSMFLAPRADKLLGANSMRFGIVALSLAWFLPAQATVPFIFGLMMGAVGMASGLLDVVMNARVSELEAKHDKPLMNANHAMFSVAYGVSALITGFAREAGFSPTVIVAGFSCFCILLVPFMRMDVTVVDADEEAKAAKYPLWPILLCGVITLSAFMTEATVEAWSALHIERTLGGGAKEGALGPAMLGFTMAFGRFSGQAVSERFSDMAVVICGSLIAAAGAVLAALAGTPLIAQIGFGIFGLGVSVIGPIGISMVGHLVRPHLRTEAISRVAVIGFSGFFFAPMLMGLVSEAFGLRTAFLCVAAVIQCAIPLVLIAARLPRVGSTTSAT